MAKAENKIKEKQPHHAKVDFRTEGVADVQFSSGMVKLSGFYRVHLT